MFAIPFPSGSAGSASLDAERAVPCRHASHPSPQPSFPSPVRWGFPSRPLHRSNGLPIPPGGRRAPMPGSRTSRGSGETRPSHLRNVPIRPREGPFSPMKKWLQLINDGSSPCKRKMLRQHNEPQRVGNLALTAATGSTLATLSSRPARPHSSSIRQTDERRSSRGRRRPKRMVSPTKVKTTDT